MLKQFNLPDFLNQSVRCLKILKKSYSFFMTHKLWKGIFEHKWILLLTVVLSVLFTFGLFADIYGYFFSSDEISDIGLMDVDLGDSTSIDSNSIDSDVIDSTTMDSDAIDTDEVDSDDDDSDSKEDNKNTAIFGGSKFLLLIMLEIVIFHFSVKTLEILNKEKYKTSFGMFMKAEIRMIKVLIRSFFQSLVVQILLWAILGIIGMSSISGFLMFIVHSYFIGNAFFDNYNEQQKLNIKESDICIRHHSGAATTLGIIASLGLMVPLIGPLVVPVFGAITANIYGFEYHIENPPHHKKEVKLES